MFAYHLSIQVDETDDGVGKGRKGTATEEEIAKLQSVHTGWLLRRSAKNISEWKPNFFVLTAGRLVFYNSSESTEHEKGDFRLGGGCEFFVENDKAPSRKQYNCISLMYSG